MTEATPEFDIKLGNCGTSKFFSVTVDNDCIVIKGKKPRKVVLKFLKNDRNSIEVRFFHKEGNTYFKKFDLGNTDDDGKEPKSRSLLNVAAFLFYDSMMPNIDIKKDIINLSSLHTPNRLQTLGATTTDLFNAIIDFVTLNAIQYQSQFKDNVNIEQLQQIINVFNDTYITPKEKASSNVEVSPSYKEGETARYTPRTETVLSNDVVSPSYKYGETATYITLFHRDGNIYYSKNTDGTVNYSIAYTSPPQGGNRKRYRTSRKYRKQQSRKKYRRHFQRHKKTHRRKSRTSRRSRK